MVSLTAKMLQVNVQDEDTVAIAVVIKTKRL
jgi:hypothetical protein